MQTLEIEDIEHKREHLWTCIENCQECYESTTQCIMHCLGRGGEFASPERICLLMDCAEICRLSADFMLRGSLLHNFTCGACSKICEHCATDCEASAPDDEHMRLCAAACRRCADSCHQMAAHHSPIKEAHEVERSQRPL